MATCKPCVNQFVSKPNQSPGIGTQVVVSILHFIDLFVIMFIFLLVIDNKDKRKCSGSLRLFLLNNSMLQMNKLTYVYPSGIFLQFATERFILKE